MNRRTFLFTASAAAAGAMLPTPEFSINRVSPSDCYAAIYTVRFVVGDELFLAN